MLVLFLLGLLLVTAAVQGEEEGAPGFLRPMCQGQLKWVPANLKKPYIVLLNGGHCPSWRTRQFFTKLPQQTHLTLPRGLPFAFLCGACHKATSRLEENISISHTTRSYDPYLLPQVSCRSTSSLTSTSR